MKVLIIGANGRLGKTLIKKFPKAITPSSKDCDITDVNQVEDFIKKNKPDIIFHLAAVTDIRRCEENKKLAWLTNVVGTQNLVDVCIKEIPNVKFIYISTACVFDGNRGNYTEEDIPYPQNFYSLTKLIGEFIVKKIKNNLIVRTHFVAKEPWPYAKAFIDRYGTYLFATGVAKGLKELSESEMTGIVHICGNKKMSMFELAKLTTSDIQPITLDEYVGPHLTVDMSLDTKRWKKYSIDD